MSFNKHRHAEYTSQSRYHFQNSISKFGRSAARDDYFAPNYGQNSPELGGTAAGAYSGYFDQETGSERHDFRCARRRPNETDRYESRSKHAFHHYKDDSHEESSRYRIIQYQHKESRNSSRCESPSRHRESGHVHMPHRRNTCRNDTHYYRSSHRSPSQCLPRKSRLRHDYRWRTKRTPSDSPTRESRHFHSHTKHHTPSHHSRTGEIHQKGRKFQSRHEDHVYSSKYKSRRHYSPTSSSCSSSSDNESSNSDSEYTSDDSFYSSGSSSDDHYLSPERQCHQPYRRRLLYEKYRHDQDDTLYQQPRSLLLSESRKDTSNEDIMPEVENRDNRDFKATRKLRALDDTPVTRSSSFKQEFLHRLDNINCMAKLILSRSQRTGFRNQPLNWRGLFL